MAYNKKRVSIGKILMYIILIIFAVVCIYPLIWVAISSLKTNDELYNNPFGFGKVLQWVNYKHAWTDQNIKQYFLNSLFVCVISTAVAAVLSSMAAYGIVRLRWRFSGLVLGLFVVGTMIPAHSAVIPLFSMFSDFHLQNSYWNLILPYIAFALPLSVFIMTGFLSTVPKELEEAAVIDGCSIIKSFWRIVLPVVKPAMATVTIFNFISMWNELLFAVIFINDPNKMTLPVGLTNFNGQYQTDYVGMMAAIIIAVLPGVVIYTLLHENIISGVTAGAVKG